MKPQGLRRTFLAVAISMLAASASVLAKGLDDFTLTKAIPADAFLAIHTRGHEGQAWLNKQYGRLTEEIEKARFDRDIKRMLKKLVQENGEPADVEKFDEQWQKVADLLAAVDWFKLADREYAFCMRFGELMPEFVSLMLPPADKAQSNFDGLAGLLKSLAALDENALKLVSDNQGDLSTHRLSVTGTPFPVVLTLAKYKDVIAIGFGPTLVEQSLALLTGKEGKTLASTPRFQDAFKKVAAPTDSAVFTDVKALMSQVRRVVDTAIKMAEAQGAPKEGEPGYEDYARGKKIPGKIFDMCDIVDYCAATRTTDGMKMSGDAVTVLRDDAKSKPLYQILFSNPPVKNPLAFVPKDASDFQVNSGVNLKAFYDTIVKMLKEDIPQGEEALAHIEELKKEGFDIEGDLLSWIQGGVVISSQPGPNAYAPGDWVFMLKVTDEAKCKAQLDKVVGMVEPMLTGNQQGSIAPAEIAGAEGFRTVNHQMLMVMGGVAPTFGVKGGWMILGSNAKYIEKTLATIAGGENVSKNARFAKEGLQPSGDVLSISFADQTKLGEQIGSMLGMLPMAKMSIPDIQKNPVLDGMFDIAARFGRVLRKLDFLNSAASITTMEGNIVRVKSVQNFREPPPPAKKSESGDAEKSEKSPKE
jgi:hypothetical protein